ncbi:MAG: hypothetical protein ACI9JN_001272 [Bacteroidia bacterium]|jgi:hypothetical protein
MKGKYLITTKGWFLAPNGQQYRSVWGNVEIVDDSLLGIKTNRNSVNWFAKVTSAQDGLPNTWEKPPHMIIAGCQIEYAIYHEDQPSTNKPDELHVHEGINVKSFGQNPIYIV